MIVCVSRTCFICIHEATYLTPYPPREDRLELFSPSSIQRIDDPTLGVKELRYSPARPLLKSAQPWQSSFRWLMDDFEDDLSTQRQFELLQELQIWTLYKHCLPDLKDIIQYDGRIVESTNEVHARSY